MRKNGCYGRREGGGWEYGKMRMRKGEEEQDDKVKMRKRERGDDEWEGLKRKGVRG
jgi:hypothetical protein